MKRLLLFFILVAVICVTLSGAANAQNTPAATSDLRERGVSRLNAGDFTESIKLLKQATKNQPTDAQSWYYLGLAYVQVKEFKKATSAFETATTLNTQYAAAYTGLSYSLLRRGKIDEAAVEASRALAIDPKSVDANYTMGVIKLRNGLRDEALKYADRAIELNPKFANGYLLRSQVLVHFTGDIIVKDRDEKRNDTILRYQAAVESLEKYVQLRGDKPIMDVWKEQLESLKFHLAANGDKSSPAEVYVGRAVTTKVRLISKPAPDYPSAALNNGVRGTVVLKAVFAADSQVKHIIIIQSLPGGLTEASVNAAKKIKFVPATKEGRPVSMFMQLEYNFNL